ncbi:MAG: suppressor of fused domain protein [Lachnospiraceae bacterium]|nr:suppressor of fused domain protein [Lachnospiraceae bacterium]
MTKEEFLKCMQEDENYSPGWQAIDDAFEKLYPGQKPDHFGTLITSRAMFGGEEFLDGFSVYTSPKGYKHLVTYGMTVLYGDEEAFGGEWNGWGYEMTMKLREDSTESCKWAIDMMSNLARYTYKTERFFEPNQFVKGNGTSLHIGEDSMITALLIVNDTEAETQMSVYGKTEFLQLVGITESEIQAIIDDISNVKKLIELMKADGNEDLVTDMRRTKSYL